MVKSNTAMKIRDSSRRKALEKPSSAQCQLMFAFTSPTGTQRGNPRTFQQQWDVG